MEERHLSSVVDERGKNISKFLSLVGINSKQNLVKSYPPYDLIF